VKRHLDLHIDITLHYITSVFVDYVMFHIMERWARIKDDAYVSSS